MVALGKGLGVKVCYVYHRLLQIYSRTLLVLAVFCGGHIGINSFVFCANYLQIKKFITKSYVSIRIDLIILSNENSIALVRKKKKKKK